MAPRKRPLEDDSVWVRHEAHLRRLYQTERKTLKEVKQTMEADYDFPQAPLSTYEANLRNLGLRKKLKKDDWPTIAQHYLNRSGKNTAVYLNGTRISTAWKEIRRSGALAEPRGQLKPLPAAIVVRTPTPSPRMAYASYVHPEPMYSTITSTDSIDLLRPSPQKIFSPILLTSKSRPNVPDLIAPCTADLPATETVPTPFERGILAPVSAAYSLWDQESVLQYQNKVYRLCLENTPIYHVMENLRNLSASANPRYSSFCRAKDTLHFLASQPLFLSQISRIGYDDSALDSQFDVYHLLGSILYVLSNNLLEDTDDVPGQVDLFDLLLEKVPRSVLLSLLESDIPTVRVAWEGLVGRSWRTSRKNAFSLLMSIGLGRPNWILSNGHYYLALATRFDNLEIVRLLVQMGCRSDESFESLTSPGTAVIGGIEAQNLNCVELLLKSCDVNRAFRTGGMIPKRSNFARFIGSLLEATTNSHVPKLGLEHRFVNQVLDMFLACGADVDLPQHTTMRQIFDFHRDVCVPMSWRLTALESAYYWNSKLFKRLEPYSANSSSEVTRFGLCLAAKEGGDDLREYLMTRSPESKRRKQRFLQLVLFEQFLIDDSYIDIDIVQSLLNAVPNITQPLPRNRDMSYLLYRAVWCFSKEGSSSDFSGLFDLLLQKGATIRPEILIAAVTPTGTYHLEKLSDLGVDFTDQGSHALCAAARLNNFEAVSWLVCRGVDFNAKVDSKAFPTNKTLLGAAIEDLGFAHHEKSIYWLDWINRPGPDTATPSREMLEFLMSLGVKLRWNGEDRSPFPLLQNALGSVTKGLLCSIQVFLNSGIDLHDPSGSDARLLEACLKLGPFYACAERFEVFELLIASGAPVRPGSPLALLIFVRGGKELIHKVLDASADVDAYASFRPTLTPLQAAASRGDQDLVDLLLSKGADINKPAYGFQGRTALQAACHWMHQSIHENKIKLNFVKFLIGRGADVNAPTSAKNPYGMTALQSAAAHGDIEVVLLLLSHRARVNALAYYGQSFPDQLKGFMTALDIAASNGRTDVTKLLLNLGAVSACPGTTGYKKAVLCARTARHHAIADMIRNHAVDDVKLFGMNPYLQNRMDDEKHDCTAECFAGRRGLAEFDEDDEDYEDDDGDEFDEDFEDDEDDNDEDDEDIGDIGTLYDESVMAFDDAL